MGRMCLIFFKSTEPRSARRIGKSFFFSRVSRPCSYDLTIFACPKCRILQYHGAYWYGALLHSSRRNHIARAARRTGSKMQRSRTEARVHHLLGEVQKASPSLSSSTTLWSTTATLRIFFKPMSRQSFLPSRLCGKLIILQLFISCCWRFFTIFFFSLGARRLLEQSLFARKIPETGRYSTDSRVEILAMKSGASDSVKDQTKRLEDTRKLERELKEQINFIYSWSPSDQKSRMADIEVFGILIGDFLAFCRENGSCFGLVTFLFLQRSGRERVYVMEPPYPQGSIALVKCFASSFQSNSTRIHC